MGRLQTLSVLFWMSYFLFSGLIGIGITYCILFYTRFWYLSVLYLSFIYWDFDTMNRGGRRGWAVNWVRSWPLWRHFCNFFPIKIVKTAELDPKQNYLLGSHPHGILCTGAVGAFGTEGADFKEIFPGITPKVLTLSVQFWFPLHRELAYCLGGCCASRRGIKNLLESEEKGVATVLVPGGARESLMETRIESDSYSTRGKDSSRWLYRLESVWCLHSLLGRCVSMICTQTPLVPG